MTDSEVSALRIAVVGIPGKWSSEALADAIEARTGFRLVIDLGQVSLDLEHRKIRYDGVNLRELDGLIVKKIDESYGWSNLDRLEILRFVESMGVPVFSRPQRLIRLIDRLACTVTLRAAGIPMPETTVTESPERAVDAILRYGAAVMKPLYSTKARGMRVIEAGDRDAVQGQVAEFQADGNPVMYIQKKLERPGRDFGVVFVGGEFVGAYARVAGEGAWSTTTREGGHYEPYEPGPEVLELARRAQKPFGLDFTTVDVVETRTGPLVFEVSAFGGFRGLQQGAGIDAADLLTNHVIGRLLA